ncbi:MAG: hypothetical protein E7637_06185 [Ruminococcaceae bacterium]|nr:hypothetical protein [Oscillospiraceae bacterium]
MTGFSKKTIAKKRIGDIIYSNENAYGKGRADEDIRKYAYTFHSFGRTVHPCRACRNRKKEGYRAIAIADHDTATAFPELKAACDREGLCGGYYSSYPTEEALKASCHYIEPLSVGVYEQNFRELQTRKINR